MKENDIDTNWLKPTVHPIYARLLCAHLLMQGFSEAQVYEGTSLDSEQLESRTQSLTPATLDILVRNALSLTQTPWLGLEMSNIARPYIHGPLGYGAIAGPDVRTSLALVQTQLPLRQELVGFDVKVDRDRVHLIITERLQFGEMREFLLALSACTLKTLIDVMTGSTPNDMVVRFSFEEPSWGDKYREYFNDVALEFACDTTSFSLPVEILDTPCIMADPQVFANAKAECDRLLQQQSLGGNLSQQLLNELASEGAPFPKLDDMAARHNMSSRTMMRKLKSENSGYQQILDEIRRESAQWQLRHNQVSIEQLSDNLGFEDPSNFSRAFQRWFDITPSEYRELNRVKKL